MKLHHSIVYLIEFIIIGGGLAFILAIPLSFFSQLFIFGLSLILYMIIGLVHHKKHHDINGKVVLEYILISVLLLTLFIFLNIAKI